MTAESIFLVGCSIPGTGRILVQTFTYGEGPARYRIDLNLGRSAEIGANSETTFNAVPAGPVVLTLSGAPDRCNVASANPRTVELPEGVLVVSQFKIHCFN
jgi:hypothetical protein